MNEQHLRSSRHLLAIVVMMATRPKHENALDSTRHDQFCHLSDEITWCPWSLGLTWNCWWDNCIWRIITFPKKNSESHTTENICSAIICAKIIDHDTSVKRSFSRLFIILKSRSSIIVCMTNTAPARASLNGLMIHWCDEHYSTYE